MTKIELNTWKPTVFFTPTRPETFVVGLTITDHTDDMEQGVLMRFVGFQVLLGQFAVNIGIEKYGLSKTTGE